ncbi:MAG: hypothetical protein E7161_00505 [Firmicutes bacterium]|nr:hypothetical protein [Bacillota bacterium]
MKKILSLLLLLLLLTGCGGNNARNAVDSYLKKYRNLSSEVLVDLENTITKENLTNEQQEKYRDVLKKQYKDLTYEIVEEQYDDDASYVTVKVSVYDLYKAQSDASIYLANNPDEFNDNTGVYDNDKYTDYKLDRMKNITEKVDYTITFTVTKENDKYVVEQPTEIDLQKIHGVYNYELD